MTGWWWLLPECRCGVPWAEHGPPVEGCTGYRPQLRGWVPALAYVTLTRAADAAETAADWIAKRWLEGPP